MPLSDHRRSKSQSAFITAAICLALILCAVLLAWAEGRQGVSVS